MLKKLKLKQTSKQFLILTTQNLLWLILIKEQQTSMHLTMLLLMLQCRLLYVKVVSSGIEMVMQWNVLLLFLIQLMQCSMLKWWLTVLKMVSTMLQLWVQCKISVLWLKKLKNMALTQQLLNLQKLVLLQ